MKIKFISLMACIIICMIAGAIGSVFTMDAIPTWYATLNKPSWTPPNWVFAPVWTTLYILMGISLYLVLQSNKKSNNAKKIFWLQLGLNVIWSVLFFGLHSPLLGMICIAALWLAIFFTIKIFYKIDRNASYLLVPYICWVTIASALNFGVLLLN